MARSLGVGLMAGTAILAGVSLARPAETPVASPSPKPAASPASAASPAAARSPRPRPSPSIQPGHVYGNEDLPPTPAPPSVASPGPSGAGRGSVTVLPKEAILPTPEPTPEPPYETTQRYWATRASTIRGAIEADERRIAELEQKIGELRDDRGVNNSMDANREQNRQAAIADAQAELEKVRADLDRQRQAMSDLEEEARRKSVPPGWLRE